MIRTLAMAAVIAAPLAGQQMHDHAAMHHRADTAFAAMQERGQDAMGVDQYTSHHRFESLDDGGRIVLQRDSVDSAGTATIRDHLRHIAGAFAAGDFSLPAFVHAGAVPGTDVMRERRDRIRYEYHPLPRGGEVRLLSSDSLAIDAIHRFLAFQREAHHADSQ